MKKLTLAKLNNALIWFLRLTLFLALFVEIYQRRWLTLFITVLALILTFFPMLFEKRYKIELPTGFELTVIFFIYLSLYLGEVHNFYLRFWWWDILLHLVSAITLGLIGFIVIIYL